MRTAKPYVQFDPAVIQKHLKKSMAAKLLDASRNYWKRRGVEDWGIVVEKKEDADEGEIN